MKTLQFIVLLAFGASLLAGCGNSPTVTATSSVGVTLSAATTSGATTINGRADGTAATIALTEVKVNIRDIRFEYDRDDDHFKKDSAFRDDDGQRLKGPFIVDLLDAGAFKDQVIASVTVPNAKFEKVLFRLSPSNVDGDMKGKSILIMGTVAGKNFIFWHPGDVKFGAKFNDSTELNTTGTAVDLAIKLETDRVLSKLNGGVDLSLAKDGNNDGTISIYPGDPDGNSDLSNAIFNLLRLRNHCEKKKRS